MIFTSCYTKNTPYEQEVKRLRESLDCLDIPYDLEPYESRGSWLANVHYIPHHLRGMLLKHPTENIVFVNADAVVRNYPSLLFDIDRRGEFDLGVHVLRYPDGHSETLTGTIYLRNTRATLNMLDYWIEQDTIEFQYGVLEQKVLENILPLVTIRWTTIPAEYCFIFDNPTQKQMLRERPYIVHYQASRRYKEPPVMSRTRVSERQNWRLQLQMWLISRRFRSNERISVLDLGTEYGLTGRSIWENYPLARITGVEVHPPTLEACKEDSPNVYNELVLSDALEYMRNYNEVYDVIVAAEIIEHLEREKGFELLRLLKEKSRLAIVTSPIGFHPLGALDGNPHERHLSGWERQDFESAGFLTFALIPYGYTLGVYFYDQREKR